MPQNMLRHCAGLLSCNCHRRVAAPRWYTRVRHLPRSLTVHHFAMRMGESDTIAGYSAEAPGTPVCFTAKRSTALPASEQASGVMPDVSWLDRYTRCLLAILPCPRPHPSASRRLGSPLAQSEATCTCLWSCRLQEVGDLPAHCAHSI